MNASVAAVLVRSSDFDNATIFIVDQISGHFPDSFAVLIRSSTMSSTGMYSSTLQVCTQVLYRYVLKYSGVTFSPKLLPHRILVLALSNSPMVNELIGIGRS